MVFTSSSGEAAKREATTVDRTTRESTAASELEMASGKLTDRKSDASLRRKIRNGRTISRVTARREGADGGAGLARASRTASADEWRSSRFLRRSRFTTPEKALSIGGGSSWRIACSVSTLDSRAH